MAQAQAAPGSDKYYIPHGSKWPIVGSVSLFTMMLGAAALLTVLEMKGCLKSEGSKIYVAK